MSFSIDRQTLEELNLLGKFRQSSVFALFNRVKTSGAEKLLDHLFHHPLQDAASINQNSAIFRFFQHTGLSFPFEPLEVSLMREYLDTDTPKNALMSRAWTFIKKGLSGLVRDDRYKKDVQGLQATIGVLGKCYAFLEDLGPDAGPYESQLAPIRRLLADSRLVQLGRTDIYRPLSLGALAAFHHLLKIRLHKGMEEILSFIYQLDLNMAVAKVAGEKKFSYATALPAEKNSFSVAGLRHPCIEGAVGNELSLHRNSNVLFLTGANMAGKSTLMKSLGIAVYLAHMGFPVAAESMEFSVREGLYSSINVSDNIGLGYSHFYAEVVRVKQAAVAAATGKRLLLMFDELFKGTNVKDAFDGTLAITRAFSNYHNCLFVVSTHIIEVGESLKNCNNIQFAYLPTVMDGPHPRYTYRLRDGITADRQGMLIIRNEGLLDLIRSNT